MGVTRSGLDTNPGSGHFLLALMVLCLSFQPYGFKKGPLSTVAAAGSGKAKFVLHKILHSCLTGWCCAFARAAPAQLGRSAGTWRVVELCPRDLETCKQKSLCAPLGIATRQAWVLPETGTTEDTSLSQTCVLFSVQPIYTLHSCYFFLQLRECGLSSLSSIFPQQTLPFSACLCWEAHSTVPPGQILHFSEEAPLTGVLIPGAWSSPSTLSHLHFPGQKLHTQLGLCEHGVCFARVTCLIISFSGGRLFLVSTVTAPLRGEAIRQRVKQVIKTLKPCAHWEGGRASSTQ